VTSLNTWPHFEQWPLRTLLSRILSVIRKRSGIFNYCTHRLAKPVIRALSAVFLAFVLRGPCQNYQWSA